MVLSKIIRNTKSIHRKKGLRSIQKSVDRSRLRRKVGCKPGQQAIRRQGKWYCRDKPRYNLFEEPVMKYGIPYCPTGYKLAQHKQTKKLRCVRAGIFNDFIQGRVRGYQNYVPVSSSDLKKIERKRDTPRTRRRAVKSLYDRYGRRVDRLGRIRGTRRRRRDTYADYDTYSRARTRRRDRRYSDDIPRLMDVCADGYFYDVDRKKCMPIPEKYRKKPKSLGIVRGLKQLFRKGEAPKIDKGKRKSVRSVKQTRKKPSVREIGVGTSLTKSKTRKTSSSRRSMGVGTSPIKSTPSKKNSPTKKSMAVGTTANTNKISSSKKSMTVGTTKPKSILKNGFTDVPTIYNLFETPNKIIATPTITSIPTIVQQRNPPNKTPVIPYPPITPPPPKSSTTPSGTPPIRPPPPNRPPVPVSQRPIGPAPPATRKTNIVRRNVGTVQTNVKNPLYASASGYPILHEIHEKHEKHEEQLSSTSSSRSDPK